MVKVLTIAKFQWIMTWRSPEQLAPVLLVPLSTLIGAAILDSGGRPDLLYYSLVAVTIMSIAQTGFMAASELFVSDRAFGILEAIVVTTASYPAVLALRILGVTASGAVGGVLSYLLLTLCFSARIAIHHPSVAIAAIVGVIFGSGCVALFLTALIGRVRSARAVQNSVSGPIYLISGVLVPVGLLSPWLELPGKAIYLSWAADLLRDSFVEGEVHNLALRILMLLLTATAWGVLGARMLLRTLDRLRRDGAMQG